VSGQKTRPAIVLFAGLNGFWKTTFIEVLWPWMDYINVDAIKKNL